VAPALAQDPPSSREAEIAQQQAEKAGKLVPEGPNKAEQYLRRLGPVVLGTEPSGFYPWFGSVLGGGWMALGAGYRTTYADTGLFNVLGGWSLKNYRMIQADLGLPTFLQGRGRVGLHGKYLFADKVAFYGLGNDSDRDDKSTYTYEPTTLGATLDLEPAPHLSIGGGYQFERVDTGGGQSGDSIDEIYDTTTAPGLGADVKYGVAHGYAAIDWRQSPGYTTKGGLYRVEYRRYHEREGQRYDFEWTEAEIRQFIPILRENWVIALRGVVTLTNGLGGDQVPYFMMPTLGSSKDLRGFTNRRFRDTNRILLQGEYRWRPSKFVDMALFYDAGKVEADRDDLDLDGLKTAYGIGVRFHSPAMTALRLEVGKSREGYKFIFSSGIF
jgi:outer membrane protein assembly factor BamA